MSATDTPPPKPRRAPRMVLTVRVRPDTLAALDRIAAARSTPDKKVTRSEVHRQAVADYIIAHDPARRRR